MKKLDHTKIIMPSFFFLALLIALSACNNDDETQAPKELVEIQLFLNSGDTVRTYPHQGESSIRFHHYKSSNPDSVTVFYQIEFHEDDASYLLMTFFKSFLIDDLENNPSSTIYFSTSADYALSENELLQVFEEGKHYLVDHEVRYSGPLLIRPSNGVNLHHFDKLYYDAPSGTTKFEVFSSVEEESNYFEIKEITKLTIDNHERALQDFDLTPSIFEFYETIYAINGSFNAEVRSEISGEVESLNSPGFTFVVYTDYIGPNP